MTEAENIYLAYPRHVARRKAVQEIENSIRRLMNGTDGTPPMKREAAVYGLLQATCKYARSPAGQRGAFTPHPSTWFHQSRYLDDTQEWFNVPKAIGIAESRIDQNQAAFERVFGGVEENSGALQYPAPRQRSEGMERPAQLLFGRGSDTRPQ